MEIKDKKPIDFIEISKKLWPRRKKIGCVMLTTLVATYLIILCIPRYYSCTVSLAPEASGPSISGSLGSLASSFGLGSSLANMGSQDAIYVEIYPEVIGSNNFIAELMTTNVETKEGDVRTNYYTYLRDHQDAAWWQTAMNTVLEWIKPTPKDSYNGNDKLSVFNLSKQQDAIFNLVQGRIKCNVDKKTSVVSITVKDQDPLVCATIAKATCEKLQKFIINYRTNKTRIDYEYYKKICAESKAAYDESREKYAHFADANTNTILASYKTQLEDMENDMQMKYNLYTTMNNQMQMSAAKLQEATPAFTVIQSASVPVKPAGPKRMFISLAMTVLAFLVYSTKLLLTSDK